MDRRIQFSRIFNFHVFGGAIIIGFMLFFVLTGLLWMTRPNKTVIEPAMAELSVIKAATSTTTQDPETQSPNSTSSQDDFSQSSGELSAGVLVYVTGTQGDGLRLRYDPGLNNEVRILGDEGEEFHIKDGPQVVDGYTWWYLVASDDDARYGWAVADFLSIHQ